MSTPVLLTAFIVAETIVIAWQAVTNSALRDYIEKRERYVRELLEALESGARRR